MPKCLATGKTPITPMTPLPLPEGGYAVKTHQPLPYPHIREADVAWQKRIWRTIDTRQKINLSFAIPEEPFIGVLLSIIQKHPDVSLFIDDGFKDSLSRAALDHALGVSPQTISVLDVDTYEEKQVEVRNSFNWMAFSKFKIKEDWIFDESTSRLIVRILAIALANEAAKRIEALRLIVRILAIAPVMDVYDEQGNLRGEKALFWLHYPSLRKYLVRYKVPSPYNDALSLTWEDVMEMRLFGSYIYKESNIYDRRIVDYAVGRDALLESERIKNEIFEYEQFLWDY